MAHDILEDDELAAELNLLTRSRGWQLLLKTAVELAKRARVTLQNSHEIGEIQSAQATLRTLKALIEDPYKRSDTTIPPLLSSLWDP